jgi:repressor LexA
VWARRPVRPEIAALVGLAKRSSWAWAGARRDPHSDSLLGAGIHDGDLAVVRPAETAEHRQIVVALVGDPDTADEATIKRYIQDGTNARLEPEHPDWQPIDPPFRIVGIVTGIMRRL